MGSAMKDSLRGRQKGLDLAEDSHSPGLRTCTSVSMATQMSRSPQEKEMCGYDALDTELTWKNPVLDQKDLVAWQMSCAGRKECEMALIQVLMMLGRWL